MGGFGAHSVAENPGAHTMQGSVGLLVLGPDGRWYAVSSPTAANGPLPVSSTPAGAADGAPPTGPPQLVAGWDGVNTQTLLTDTTGALVTTPAQPATYVASGTFAIAAAGGGGVAFQMRGSATKKIRILRLTHQGESTAANPANVSFNKATSTATGGNSVLLSMNPMDSADPPATALAAIFTTLGALPAVQFGFYALQQVFPAAATGPTPAIADYEAPPGGQALTLSGVNEFLNITLQSTAAGHTSTVTVVWTEQ